MHYLNGILIKHAERDFRLCAWDLWKLYRWCTRK